MTYFESTPIDLLGEILMYLDNPLFLSSLENIYPFNLVMSNPIFWFNKFKIEFPELNIEYYGVNKWNSIDKYKQLYDNYSCVKNSVNKIDDVMFCKFLLFQYIERVPIIQSRGSKYYIVYLRNENKYYEQFTDEEKSCLIVDRWKEISKPNVINIITYMKYNNIPLDIK